MFSKILSLFFTTVLIISFTACGGGSDDGGATDNTPVYGAEYTISQYVDYETAQTWDGYDGSSTKTGTTTTVFDESYNVITMTETDQDANVEIYQFHNSYGTYSFLNGPSLPFDSVYGLGGIMFTPESIREGETVSEDYTATVDGETVGGTVKITLDEHYDSINIGAYTYTDVIKITWIYIDGVSTNAPMVSQSIWMAKGKGWVKTMDNLESYYGIRTDLGTIAPTSLIAQNLSATDGNYSDKITISWDSVTGASLYIVYRADSSTNVSVVYDSTASTSYEDTDVTSDYLYTYYVKAMVDGSAEDASESDTGYIDGYVTSGTLTPTLILDKSTLSVDESATGTITATATTDGSSTDTITATSSSTSVATVSVSGNVVTVTGVSAGTSTVTVTSGSTLTETVTVTVNTSTLVNEGSTSSPVSLTLDTVHNGKIGASTDSTTRYSYYSFTTTMAGDYNVSSSLSSSEVYFYLYSGSIGGTYVDGTVSGDSRIFSLASSTTYYLKVMSYTSADTTYDLLVKTPAAITSTVLTLGTKSTGSIDNSADVLWYSFDATSGTDYSITWEDMYDYAISGTYTGDVKVSVYREDGATLYDFSYSIGGTTYSFENKDSGYSSPKYINALASEKVMIKVEGYFSSSTGTFAITATQQ